jgi:PIN domain nuclease of toxin-antitoxin system
VGERALTLLLDTHVLLWWLLDGEGLSPSQIEALERSAVDGDLFGMSAMSLWEIAKLVERGRVELHQSPDAFMDDLDRNPQLTILPITPRIALESTRLGPTFHRDPADQLIAATARVHGLRLVTADERIRSSGAVAVV